MWKARWCPHDPAKERNIICETRNPVRRRLEGWEGAGLGQAGGTRLKSVTCGGRKGEQRETGRQRDQLGGDDSHPGGR